MMKLAGKDNRDFTMCLPEGEEAALLKGAFYNVPGIFLFSELLFQLMDIVYDKTGYNIPVQSMYGAPQLRWNSGRLILNHYSNDFSIHGIEKELLKVQSRKITPLMTFSNLFIDQQSLKDEKCNDVLKILNDTNGGVIVANDQLKYYIEEHYPNISIHASVLLTALEEHRNKDYYKRLSGAYEYYVLHPDDNFNLDLLANVPKENAEIIVNERCVYHCKIRKDHYKAISLEQIAQADGQYFDVRFLDQCAAIPEIKQSKTNQRTISLTISEMKILYHMGYRCFKLQGRTDHLSVFFFDLLRYTLEPEIVFPTIYPILAYYIESFEKGRRK